MGLQRDKSRQGQAVRFAGPGSRALFRRTLPATATPSTIDTNRGTIPLDTLPRSPEDVCIRKNPNPSVPAVEPAPSTASRPSAADQARVDVRHDVPLPPSCPDWGGPVCSTDMASQFHEREVAFGCLDVTLPPEERDAGLAVNE